MFQIKIGPGALILRENRLTERKHELTLSAFDDDLSLSSTAENHSKIIITINRRN